MWSEEDLLLLLVDHRGGVEGNNKGSLECLLGADFPLAEGANGTPD
jgi:hypothetical protein